jgi:hypothetical protein
MSGRRKNVFIVRQNQIINPAATAFRSRVLSLGF